ncbi:hypothetical protein C8R45DRAFT_754416, partial [Mycena sanguinolenta]
ELLKKKPTQIHDNYAWAVYTTWEMSFCKLSGAAAMFLQLCCFLHQDDIYEEIFSRAANHILKHPRKSKRLQKLESRFKRLFSHSSQPKAFLSHFIGSTGDWNSLQFLEIINELKAYSLVNYNKRKDSFSIHPLVHSW